MAANDKRQQGIFGSATMGYLWQKEHPLRNQPPFPLIGAPAGLTGGGVEYKKSQYQESVMQDLLRGVADSSDRRYFP